MEITFVTCFLFKLLIKVRGNLLFGEFAFLQIHALQEVVEMGEVGLV